ncbi:hypothetical protein ASF59_00070 [Methylobacterium sp. Leaf121]|nr:hypothetical protein ASF59_00070 [Methylobacterium sp. Leaf121]
MDVFATLGTVWAPHLTASEFVLVAWLLANAVPRGKRSGVYSISQFVEGVPNHRDGGMWTAGTGLSEKTVRRAIASCLAKGVIHTSRDPRGTRFAVVLSWNPATGKAEESNVVSLNLPRAARRAQSEPSAHMQAAETDDQDDWEGGQFDREGVVNLTRDGGQIDHPSIEIPTNQETYREDPDATASRPVIIPEVRIRKRPAASVPILARSGFGKVDASPRCAAPPPAEASRFDPRQSVTAAIDAAGKARAQRLVEARKRIDTNAYATTWVAAWGEAYPGSPHREWTQKAAGILKKAVEGQWTSRHRPQVHDFLEWVVGNWDVILASKFAWMRESPPPAMPEIEFVARQMRKFQEAWAEREELRFRGTLPGQQQAAHALAKREGIMIDVALARVIAKDAAEKARREINEIAASAARDKRIAKLAAAQANAPRFTRDNPHPRAHENVRTPIVIPGGADIEPFSIQPITFNPDAFDAP